MKIIVKISDIEVEVEHNNPETQSSTTLNNDFDTIKKLLESTVKHTIELYNNRIEKLK